MGISDAMNVGTQVSHMWLCWPSAFSPAVGARVVSDTGEPVSPMVAAAAIKRGVAPKLRPSSEHRGTYSTDRTGTVPKEVPVPITITRPTSIITKAPRNLLPSMNTRELLTSSATALLSLSTKLKPLEASMTKAINPIS